MKIAFDVDDTLITAKDTPKYPTIQLLDIFERLGWEVYIWSGGGVEYATHWRDKLGLSWIKVIEKGSVAVDIAVDDQEIPPEGVNAKVVIKV